MKAEISVKLARCKGCGICAAFCPKSVLGIDELGKVVVAHPEDCIGCGQCELRCPDYAVFVDKVTAKGGAA
ncbi:2-oxoglutarate ferredoxin oxidoreductase subunit delta [Selenomonas ruminantium]|uniref:2-oxoglutarate ferredoxin oxidoreductase subunit delta n=1 Tax=Selenomonas ruminantium TaxID=971 RepID=A0A1M6VRY4_SELRU|nr:4Fe-4S binding protein [Selenomonas ruminantium]SHK84121.1 2-oxoglutarate ferredoxin oxidoreductase subunit delta [Selenomonas ruminantium]